ncbi:hypothetical protein [Streptomyces sp. NPDC005799]|uniref:hypothetical protein n=1 Tax=Streptomyces sp. NPDC005799 TaxID=3154678 RepID=UPI0033F05DFB
MRCTASTRRWSPPSRPARCAPTTGAWPTTSPRTPGWSAWQHLLRGNALHNPAGFLAMRARRRAVDHYRLARVRREEPSTTPTNPPWPTSPA